jgi:hypothetical protein
MLTGLQDDDSRRDLPDVPAVVKDGGQLTLTHGEYPDRTNFGVLSLDGVVADLVGPISPAEF